MIQKRKIYPFALHLAAAIVAWLLWNTEVRSVDLPCFGKADAESLRSTCAILKDSWSSLALGKYWSNSIAGTIANVAMALLLWLRIATAATGLKTLYRAALGISVLLGILLALSQLFLPGFCPWCLAITAILIVCAVLEWKTEEAEAENQQDTRLWFPWVFALFFSIILFLNFHLETKSNSQAAFEKRLAKYIDPALLRQFAPCGLDQEVIFPEFAEIKGLFQAGNTNAEIVLTVFFDPMCENCHQLDSELHSDQFVYKDLLRIEFIPISALDYPIVVKSVVHAALEDNGSSFLLDRVFEQQEVIKSGPLKETWRAFLDVLLEDPDPFIKDAEASERAAAELKRFHALADRADLDNVPALFLNGQRVNTGHSGYGVDCLIRQVDRMLKTKDKK